MPAPISRSAAIHAAMMRKFAFDAYKNGGGEVGLDYAISRYVDEAGYIGAMPAFIGLSAKLDRDEPLGEGGSAGGLTINVIAEPVNTNRVLALEAMLPEAARVPRR